MVYKQHCWLTLYNERQPICSNTGLLCYITWYIHDFWHRSKHHKFTFLYHMIRHDFWRFQDFLQSRGEYLLTWLKAELETVWLVVFVDSLCLKAISILYHARFCAWPTPTGGCPPTWHKKESVCGPFSVSSSVASTNNFKPCIRPADAPWPSFWKSHIQFLQRQGPNY